MSSDWTYLEPLGWAAALTLAGFMILMYQAEYAVVDVQDAALAAMINGVIVFSIGLTAYNLDKVIPNEV